MSWITPGNVFRPFSSSDWPFRSLLDEFDSDDFFSRDSGRSLFSGSRRPLDRLRRHRIPAEDVRLAASPPESHWYSRTSSSTDTTTSASNAAPLSATAGHHQSRTARSLNESSPHQKTWTTAIDLVGFKPEEIAVKCEGDRLRIRARREEGEDLNEVRRTLTIPADVDAEKVSTTLTVEGALVVKAPLLVSSSQQQPRGSESSQTVADDTMSSCSQDLSWDDVRSLVRGQGIQPIGCLVAAAGSNDAAGKAFKAEILVREFHPQEIKVRQKGDQVYIEAESRQEKEGQVEMRRLERSFTLPSGVDVENLVSRLTEDGRLLLEAPFLVADAASTVARGVPIEGVTVVVKAASAALEETGEATGGK